MAAAVLARAPINHALATIVRALAPINQASLGWIATQAARLATEAAANDSTARSGTECVMYSFAKRHDFILGEVNSFGIIRGMFCEV